MSISTYRHPHSWLLHNDSQVQLLLLHWNDQGNDSVCVSHFDKTHKTSSLSSSNRHKWNLEGYRIHWALMQKKKYNKIRKIVAKRLLVCLFIFHYLTMEYLLNGLNNSLCRSEQVYVKHTRCKAQTTFIALFRFHCSKSYFHCLFDGTFSISCSYHFDFLWLYSNCRLSANEMLWIKTQNTYK